MTGIYVPGSANVGTLAPARLYVPAGSVVGALDPAGEVPKAYGLIGMPTSYLVDRNGVVRLRNQSFKPQDIDTLRTEISKLVKESPHAS